MALENIQALLEEIKDRMEADLEALLDQYKEEYEDRFISALIQDISSFF